jgi:hypothetical protein
MMDDFEKGDYSFLYQYQERLEKYIEIILKKLKDSLEVY